jgi:hypothetical protein
MTPRYSLGAGRLTLKASYRKQRRQVYPRSKSAARSSIGPFTCASPFPPPALLTHCCIRSLPPKATVGTGHDFYARGGLEIKVCVRTYRLFYVSRTEDVLWRILSTPEQERAHARLAARNASRVRRLDKFTSKGGGASTSGTGPSAVE